MDNTLLVVLLVLALAALLFGVFTTLKWLIIVAVVLAIVGLVSRTVGGRRRSRNTVL